MANANLEKIQGVNVVVYARKLAQAAKVAGQLIPYQTSLSIDPQRDSDKKKTKSGTVTTTSSLETDFKFEFVNNWSKIADQLLDSIFDNEEMEFWAVNRQRKNSEGQYYALYLRGKVTEDSNDNDPDDVSSRETTITVDYGPVRGWVTLSEEQEAELAYIFRGVGAIEGTPKNDGTDGAGKAWNKETDAGQGVSDNQEGF